MKKYILALVALAMITISCNEEAPKTEDKASITPAVEESKAKALETPPTTPTNVVTATTTIEMDKMEHDFGEIGNTDPVHTTFTIKNTGDNPLIITQAKGSCGCTVPTYPKEPIAPGETGSIEVSYNPKGNKGAQSKTVTLIANTEPANTVLFVKSVVKE